MRYARTITLVLALAGTVSQSIAVWQFRKAAEKALEVARNYQSAAANWERAYQACAARDSGLRAVRTP